MASTSRLLKITGLFCKRARWKRLYSAKETYNFKEPTNRSHPILLVSCPLCSYTTWLLSSPLPIWLCLVPPLLLSSRHALCKTHSLSLNTSTHCNTLHALQHTAARCNSLQHTVMNCNTPCSAHHPAHYTTHGVSSPPHSVATLCSLNSTRPFPFLSILHLIVSRLPSTMQRSPCSSELPCSSQKSTLCLLLCPLRSYTTDWHRPIKCLIFIRHFPQKSLIIGGSSAEKGIIWVLATLYVLVVVPFLWTKYLAASHLLSTLQRSPCSSPCMGWLRLVGSFKS